ncbi:MAG: helix-turn-helix transcriptional regulator [Bacilli bacterium]|nr:helix-turn-helix transcriptional regulator [Bacilli bacterium]
MSDISNLGNKEVLAHNLRYYLKVSGKTASDVCSDLEITPSTFSDWMNAKKYPRIDNIEMLANYFGIKKSNLIEDFDQSKTIDETEILFSKYKDHLSDKDKMIIKTILEETKKEIDEELGED